MKRALGFSVAVAFVLGCGDHTPTGLPSTPQLTISDAVHSKGNPDFFFLPPMVPDPSSDPAFEEGKFNGNLGPTVEICELTETDPTLITAATPCADPQPSGFPIVYTTSSGPGSETIRVNTTDEHYIVNWHTDQFSLSTGKFYRIRVRVGSVPLGFADVDLVSSGKELRNVQTGEYIGLVDDRTLPIKFRIEDGALCDPPGSPSCSSGTIDLAEGGTVVFEPTGDRLDIPPQDDPSQGSITFTLSLCDGIDVDLPTFGNCLHIDSDPAQIQPFSPRATVSICSATAEDLTGITTEQDPLLLLHRQDDQGNVEALPKVPGFCETTVGDAGGNALLRFARAVQARLVALVAPLPLFGRSRLVVIDVGGGGESDFSSDFQFALPAQMEPVEGTDDQTGSPGQPVAKPPAVFVSDVNGNPVFGAVVHFEVTDGGGTVTPMSVPSGSNGIAAVESWTLGSAPGTNTVRAFGSGIAGPGDGGPFVPDASLPLAEQTPVPVGEGEVFFVASACETQPCSAGTIDLSEGGTVILEATGDRLDIPPQDEPEFESIRFTLELCDGIDVDLPTYGNCFRITADPPQSQAFSPRATISICSALPEDLVGLGEGQDDLLVLHRQEGETIEALPKVAGFCNSNSSPTNGMGDAGGNALRRFARALRDRVVAILTPPPLLARSKPVVVIDVGGGGESDFSSDFQFALPAQMEPLEGTDEQTAGSGSPVATPPGVSVRDKNGGPVAGATVHFEVTQGGGTVTPLAVVSNSSGVAQVSEWVLGEPGTNQLRAFGFGIAGPADGGPFVPDASLLLAEQTPVLLGEGEVFFNATALIRVAGVGANDGRRAADAAFTSGDLDGTIARITEAQFNALTPAELRAQYDVLIITWNSLSELNVDWETRLLPYLEAGGGVLFDGDPNNIDDLAAIAATKFLSVGGESALELTVSATVPGLTDGINNLFANNHIRFATFPTWDPALSPFLKLSDDVVGLWGRFGTGCIILTGPDQDFHGLRGSTGFELNQYNLLLNELRFARTCP